MSFVIKIKDRISGRPYEVTGYDEEDRAEVYTTFFGVPMAMPLKMKKRSDSEWWLLPWEPFISCTGTNVIIKRSVAKASRSGTIKERWTQGDYDITIEGIFYNPESDKYPRAEIERMRDICEAAEPIDVAADMFEALGITAMAIEDYEFPFSKGSNTQQFKIKASSDKDWELFMEVNRNVS